MQRLVILGGGTAGTIMANKLARELDSQKWQITLVDVSPIHYYQPGFLFIPFGIYAASDVVKPRRDFLPPNVQFVLAEIDRVDPDQKAVLAKDGSRLPYDYLIIATGARIRPDQIEGLQDENWHVDKFDFYTLEGAAALRNALQSFRGGRLVVNVAEMPIKCPVAPLEFVFLADSYLREAGLRDRVELTFVTSLPGAFTRPKASELLAGVLAEKQIHVVPDFGLARVDNENRKLIAWDDMEVPYDLLVSVPTNMGDEAIARSGMGDELNFIPTDKETLQSKAYPNIFVLGDATNLPSSKAGSVAHFQADILTENFLAFTEQKPMHARFDGHANCFIETGGGKGILIDFNYDTEPLPGTYPLAGLGPLSLLKSTSLNHYGKLMFRWVYWHLLLSGKELPIGSAMSFAGKVA